MAIRVSARTRGGALASSATTRKQSATVNKNGNACVSLPQVAASASVSVSASSMRKATTRRYHRTTKMRVLRVDLLGKNFPTGGSSGADGAEIGLGRTDKLNGSQSYRRRGTLATRLGAAADGEAKTTEVISTMSSAAATMSAKERNGEVIDDTVFNISQVSFGTIGSVTGVVFLVYGFLAYFDTVPGGPVSSLILTYGFPITILGFALKYAELKPVPCVTYSKASAIRERQATSILKQVKDDVTRYRYGDEQHLDLAMERIFRIGRGGGVPRRECPVLTGVREEISETNGNYALVLEFDAKKLGLEGFEKYREKFQTFFGPGITAEMKSSSTTENAVDVWLISVGDSAGGQTDENVEILPPLMPGLPARKQVKQSSE